MFTTLFSDQAALQGLKENADSRHRLKSTSTILTTAA